eukprot:2248828-Pleurochrysis_carterae.AAC.1
MDSMALAQTDLSAGLDRVADADPVPHMAEAAAANPLTGYGRPHPQELTLSLPATPDKCPAPNSAQMSSEALSIVCQNETSQNTIPSLHSLCCEAVINVIINLGNVLDVIHFCRAHNVNNLHMRAVRFVRESWHGMCQHNSKEDLQEALGTELFNSICEEHEKLRRDVCRVTQIGRVLEPQSVDCSKLWTSSPSSGRPTLPSEILCSRSLCPAGVDLEHRERFLSSRDFMRLLGCTQAQQSERRMLDCFSFHSTQNIAVTSRTSQAVQGASRSELSEGCRISAATWESCAAKLLLQFAAQVLPCARRLQDCTAQIRCVMGYWPR